MSRRGMPNKSKQTPPASEPSTTIPGGVVEHTLGKDDVQISITRSDPGFEDREALAEKLWESEKDRHVPITGGDTEGEEGATSEEKDPETEEEVGTKPAEDQEIEGDEEEGTETAEEPDSETQELLVDGEKVIKSKAEIAEVGGVRNMQKILAADRRLEQATRERQEATRLLKEIQEAAKAGLPPKGGATQEESALSTEQQERIKALGEKWKYGDEEESQEALQQLLAEGRNTATPQLKQEVMQDVVRLLYQQKIAQEARRVHSVFTAAPEDDGYADIYPKEKGGKCEDPEVWEFFDYKINSLVNAGEPQELATYRKAADAVRKRFATIPPDALAEKRERKRGIDVVQGVKAKSPAIPKDKTEIHDDIINWHRKDRGQA